MNKIQDIVLSKDKEEEDKVEISSTMEGGGEVRGTLRKLDERNTV